MAQEFRKQNIGSLEYAEQEPVFTQSCNGILTFKYTDSLVLRTDVLVPLDTLRKLLVKLSPEESYDLWWSWSCYQLPERRYRSGDLICHNRFSSFCDRQRTWMGRQSLQIFCRNRYLTGQRA